MGDLGAEGSPKDRRLTARALERLRRLCLSLPETNERESNGERGWFVRDRKLFVTFVDHHHDDRVGFWCAASPGDQAALVSADPARFFVPPYVGHRGWLGVYLDVPVDSHQVAEIVTDAYRVVAPKRLAARIDERARAPGVNPSRRSASRPR